VISDTVLQRLIVQISGEPSGKVIWMNENAPRPVLPYLAIRVSPARRINKDRYSDVDANGIQTVVGDREFTLSVQAFGYDSPVSYLQYFADKLQLITNNDRFRAQGMALRDTSTVMDISALLSNTKIEKRANLDLTIGYRSVQTDNVGVIETANIEGRDNGINSPVYTIIADV
jgi:hypothetical protein